MAVKVGDHHRPRTSAPAGSSSRNSFSDSSRVNSVRRARHPGDQCRKRTAVCGSSGEPAVGRRYRPRPRDPAVLRDEAPLVGLVAHVLDHGVGQGEVDVVVLERHVAAVGHLVGVGDGRLRLQADAHPHLAAHHDRLFDDAGVRPLQRRQRPDHEHRADPVLVHPRADPGGLRRAVPDARDMDDLAKRVETPPRCGRGERGE